MKKSGRGLPRVVSRSRLNQGRKSPKVVETTEETPWTAILEIPTRHQGRGCDKARFRVRSLQAVEETSPTEDPAAVMKRTWPTKPRETSQQDRQWGTFDPPPKGLVAAAGEGLPASAVASFNRQSPRCPVRRSRRCSGPCSGTACSSCGTPTLLTGMFPTTKPQTRATSTNGLTSPAVGWGPTGPPMTSSSSPPQSTSGWPSSRRRWVPAVASHSRLGHGRPNTTPTGCSNRVASVPCRRVRI